MPRKKNWRKSEAKLREKTEVSHLLKNDSKEINLVKKNQGGASAERIARASHIASPQSCASAVRIACANHIAHSSKTETPEQNNDQNFQQKLVQTDENNVKSLHETKTSPQPGESNEARKNLKTTFKLPQCMKNKSETCQKRQNSEKCVDNFVDTHQTVPCQIQPAESNDSSCNINQESYRKDHASGAASSVENMDLSSYVRTLNYKENYHTFLGSYNQGSSHFPPESRGRQCTCNALASLVSLHLKSFHNRNDLDTILVEGDNLYRETLALLSSTRQLQSEYLRLDELPENFDLFGVQVKVTKLMFLTGQINKVNIFVSLQTGLLQAFEQTDSVLLMIDSFAMSVFKDGNQYVFFDSHSHGYDGLQHPYGSSVMMTFSCFEDVVIYLLKYSSSLGFQNETLFDMQPVKIHFANTGTISTIEETGSSNEQTNSLMDSYFSYQSQQTISKSQDRKLYMRQYQRHRRLNPDIRQVEKIATLKSKRCARSNPQFKEHEKASKAKARENPVVQQKEKIATLKSMQSARSDPQFKEHEKASKAKARENPVVQQKDKIATLKSKRSARSNPQFKEHEKASKAKARENPVVHQKEKIATLKSMQSARSNPQFKTRECEAKRLNRSDPVKRRQEMMNECASKRRRREEPLVKEQERITKRQKRLDTGFHQKECTMNMRAKAVKRKCPDFVAKEKENAKNRRLSATIDTCISKFHESVALGPCFLCTVCHQMLFRQSVVQAELDKINVNMMDCFSGLKSFDNKEWVCHTCMKHLKDGKIPPLSLANGMKFPEKPEALDLHQLEERLIALRIPFMQMRELPRGGQTSIRGNVVNVPSDISSTVNSLPLNLSESGTIPMKLKRKLSYNSSAFVENVRPNKVMKGLKWLMENSELYRQSNITIDKAWENTLSTYTQAELSQFVEFPSQNKPANPEENEPIFKEANESFEDSDNFSETDDREIPTGNSDTMLDDNSHLNMMYSVAPGEGQHPLSVFQDKDAESLAFPSIYCGQKQAENSERQVPIHYSDQIKWELRCRDRRVANCVPNLFFKVKKSQMKQVKDKATLALRRCKTKSKKLTAKQMLDSDHVKHLVNLDDGFYIFRTLRNSPPYLEKRKKDVFAMIRQLGLPTWFTSFSAADTKWTDLLRILGRFVDKKEYSDDEINNLSWEERSRLLKGDPVTCARFFDYRVHQFINNVLKSHNNPVGHIVDYFYRVEFQQRGSPHIHMLVWIENAPKYGESPETEIVEFIDKYIQCSGVDSSDELSELLNLQMHKHSKTCRKQGKAICRFGFPLPPMRETMILEPLDDGTDQEKEEYSNKYEKLHQLLDSYKDASSMTCTYEEFLENIADMTHDEYIRVIRSSLKGPKVFLKRSVSEIRLNSYNRTLMKAWKANLDIQFVLDPYACAMYIVAYVSKSQRGMSNLLDRACREAREGNFDLRRQVRHIGNKFLNSVEISAQEAAYLLLQLPLTKSSREVIFINTSKPEERTFLMKSKEQLQELPSDSTDIESENLITRYAKRPKQLQHWCLADYASKLNFSSPKTKNKFHWNAEEYEILQTNDNDEDDDVDDGHDNDDHHCNENSACQVNIRFHNGGMITSRKNPKVIRYVNFNKNVDNENYCRERIMLYVPWRNEQEDLYGQFETYADNFMHHKKEIDAKMSEYELKAEVLEEAQQMVNDDLNFDQIAPNTEHEEAIDADAGSRESEQFAFFNPDEDEHRNYDIGQDIGLSGLVQTENILPNLLPDDDYKKLMQSLNIKQRELITHIIQWIRDEKEPFHIFLSGGAGVGKSVVVRVLYQTLYKMLNTAAGENPHDTRILLLAPTGKAAYNIKGNTIHSAFALPASQKLQHKPLSADQLNSLRTKYKNLSVLIIDEVSMCGKRMFSIIDQRLREIKGNNTVFGGVHVLLVGDLFQLRPVMDGWIFDDLDQDYGPLATNLWRELFTMHELTEIMRQKDDKTFAQILNRLREGKKLPPENPTKEQLDDYAHYERQFERQMTEDIETLKMCCVDAQDPSYRASDPHLFPTNALVRDHNDKVFNETQGHKCIINSLDAVVGDLSRPVKEKLKTKAAQGDPAKTAGLFDSLPVACGMRYELCSNLDVVDGLTNGASGVLKHFENKLAKTDRPSILWIEFDDENVGNQRRRKYHRYYHTGIGYTWTPIFDITRSFSLNLRTKNASIIRIQFPLRPSAAKTIHKSQGDTMDSVVVHMGTSKRAFHHMHYVALSRVRNMSGLQILELNPTAISVSNDVKQEMKTLREARSLKLCFQPLYTMQNTFIVAFQNARSFHCHYDDVKSDPNLMAADVLGIAETRLTCQDSNDDISLPMFNTIRCDAARLTPQRPHHGLVTYVKQQHNVESYQMYTSRSLEFIVLTLAVPYHLQIVVLYRSPSTSLNQFYSDMETTLVPRVNNGLPLILTGDFNVDILKENVCFSNFMNAHFHCTQLIRETTTVYGSAIDLIFTNCPTILSGAIVSTFSDHSSVFVALNLEQDN